jgi:hypothetical protein
MEISQTATTIQLLGAGGFGTVIGWYVYYTNRYRKDDVKLSDVVTLMGVLGGAGIVALFPARTDLFGCYGIGLFIGFFGYFFILLLLVAISKNFTLDWFLDGRRIKPSDPFYIPSEVQTPPHPPMERLEKPKINV